MRRSCLAGPALGAALVAWPLLAAAEPKVCGNQAALGNFREATCLVLRDDGAAPDDVKGDGVFSGQATLAASELLLYKVLPSGTFGADQIQQVGDCDPQGMRTNTFSNLQLVKAPAGPASFYYDSAGKTAGDSLMAATPAGVTWVAVGTFQDPIFDPTRGVVPLAPAAPGVLRGALVAPRALAAGWEWKVLEGKGTYDRARKYGADGWSYSPCDSKNVVVSEAVQPGDTIELVFHTRTGRLQTLVTRGRAGDDQPAAEDLRPPPDDGGAVPGGGDMLDPAALPGIRCNCRVGGPGAPGDGDAGAAPGGLLLLAVLARRARRVFRAGPRGRH